MKSIHNPNQPADFSLNKILEAARQEATGSKTTAYVATTILTGVIFAAISILMIFLIRPERIIPIMAIFSLLYALAFSPIRYALEELIRQLFPGTDYNSHELIKSLNRISYSTLTRQDLATQYFAALRTSIDAGGISFIFYTSKSKATLKSNELMDQLKHITQAELLQLKKVASYYTQTISRWPDPHTKKICHDYQIRLLVPLYVNDEIIGILALGPKLDNKHYTTKDIKVLNAIAPKLGYAVKNTRAYEKVIFKNQDLITELRSANDNLRKANRQLRHDDKLKDEFVFIATHELKNPVTAVKGYLSLIREGSYGKVPEKISEAIGKIEQSNQQLIGLLNNLLQIARTEAERLEINTQPIAICPIIDQVLSDLGSLIDQKGLTASHTCPNKSVMVMADKERLVEIFNNLVSNAIKYSERGTIDISHEIVQDKLVTHVKDEGVGISAKDQKKIFTRFFRVEEEAAKGIPGTGLGLFLVKQLIEKMGGHISFTSEPGKGSNFSLSLPLARTYSLKSKD
jgi:signal transduction histidine kinase